MANPVCLLSAGRPRKTWFYVVTCLPGKAGGCLRQTCFTNFLLITASTYHKNFQMSIINIYKIFAAHVVEAVSRTVQFYRY